MEDTHAVKTLADHAREQEAYWRSLGTSSSEVADIAGKVTEIDEIISFVPEHDGGPIGTARYIIR